jgi:protein-lysine N-methyltransferase EEF2KMT
MVLSGAQGVFEGLLSRMTSLFAQGMAPHALQTNEPNYVTFTCLLEREKLGHPPTELSVTLLERPHLVAGSVTTGFRTWEASLHLGSYLLTRAGQDLVRDKNVLELGAGTGFLGILCARHLHSSHVTITDGDSAVVQALGENCELNGLEDGKHAIAKRLLWGKQSEDTWLDTECQIFPCDVVIGADIVSCGSITRSRSAKSNSRPTSRRRSKI